MDSYSHIDYLSNFPALYSGCDFYETDRETPLLSRKETLVFDEQSHQQVESFNLSESYPSHGSFSNGAGFRPLPFENEHSFYLGDY